ncbi:type II secretion system protein N (GspN) [Ferrimonas sediminum]|uniref:Type II secretion system protein N n=1 Tax=Ferrimonas sediminum TaxID=718193 RepID=A0A1G8ZHD4_9GAMM|nr:type II secretion system protein N [Ferrimonas sediminum]SDK14448.1 type II secretion system protein N (GspN) [Ferrimonas sediminum]
MRFVKYGVAALALYILFLVITVPVSMVWQLAPKPKGVQVLGLEGSLWQGRAATLTVSGRTLENLSWKVAPGSLLQGKVEAAVSVSGAISGRGTVAYGLSGLEVEGLRLDSPVSVLVGKRRLPFRTQVAGEINLNLADGAQGQPWCERLDGRLMVQQLDVNNQFGQFPLGNLSSKLSCQQGNLMLTMTEQDNRIGVSGTAMLKANMQVELDARIRATDSQPEALTKSLGFLGQADASGAYPLQYSGRIPGF